VISITFGQNIDFIDFQHVLWKEEVLPILIGGIGLDKVNQWRS